MQAVILRSPRKLELADTPVPKFREEEDVLIRVKACGICGSDLRYWAGENPWALHTLGRHVDNPPNIILGHEFAGVVEAVNSSRYKHLIGTRVGAQAYRVCGNCEFCRSGRQNLCRQTVHMGHAQGWGAMDVYPGAYAEYCPAWADLLYPLPDDVSFEEAAMADILCVAVHVVGRSKLPPDAAVLCIGGGPIGLSVAQVARASGARNVFISEPSPVAQRVLTQFDFVVIDPSREALAEAIERGTGKRRVAAVYDSVGSAQTMAEGLPLLEESGTYVNLAVHRTQVTLDAALLGSERTITTSSNAFYSDVAEAYELIFAHRVNVRPMITHCVPLADYRRAFELLLSDPKQAYKVVFHPGA
jgi:threonine dehydrogenase-like Zn-dependent dehydrogenase